LFAEVPRLPLTNIHTFVIIGTYQTGDDEMKAEKILQQLGGAKFQVMTGASNFVAIECGLQFSFKGNKEMNKCRITLAPDDTYTVEFFKLNRSQGTCDLVKDFSMVYAESLQAVFTQASGLYTRL
jgi:hypothetical protein